MGRLLTRKVGEIADGRGTALYIEAGPQADALFRTEGYEELERVDIDLGEFGAEGGVVQMYVYEAGSAWELIVHP